MAQQLGAELLSTFRGFGSGKIIPAPLDRRLHRPEAASTGIAGRGTIASADRRREQAAAQRRVDRQWRLAKVPDTIRSIRTTLFHQGMGQAAWPRRWCWRWNSGRVFFFAGADLSLDAINAVGQMAEAHGLIFRGCLSWASHWDDSHSSVPQRLLCRSIPLIRFLAALPIGREKWSH